MANMRPTKNEMPEAEDRDEWEYLYSVSELVALKGNRFAQKRAHVHSFLTSYDWEYLPLLPEDFPELLAFQAAWRRRREAESPDAQTDSKRPCSYIRSSAPGARAHPSPGAHPNPTDGKRQPPTTAQRPGLWPS